MYRKIFEYIRISEYSPHPGVDLLVDGVDLRREGVDLLGEGVDLRGEGVDLLGDGGDPKSIAGGSSKTTVVQMGDQRLEIQKCDQLTNLPTNQPTNQLTWVGARDTCVSKNQ